MPRSDRKAPPPQPDPENGFWQGRSVARRFVSPDGLTVLVGRTAEDNDVLTFRLGSPQDFWLHVAAESGSHVVVRNPEGLDRLPKENEQLPAPPPGRLQQGAEGGEGGRPRLPLRGRPQAPRLPPRQGPPRPLQERAGHPLAAGRLLIPSHAGAVAFKTRLVGLAAHPAA